uniref:Uncharacterized protein n=1 Tax=Oryza barthii TaxID=65489 RepID=A0A0D3GVP3_9ORYZ
MGSNDHRNVALAVDRVRVLSRRLVRPLSSGHAPRSYAYTAGSSPRFDVLGNDFGWGRPVSVWSGGVNKFDGKVTVYEGPDGAGSMSLEVCLAPAVLAKLIADEEFMEAVSGQVETNREQSDMGSHTSESDSTGDWQEGARRNMLRYGVSFVADGAGGPRCIFTVRADGWQLAIELNGGVYGAMACFVLKWLMETYEQHIREFLLSLLQPVVERAMLALNYLSPPLRAFLHGVARQPWFKPALLILPLFIFKITGPNVKLQID